MIDWKSKLTSRKFWAAIASFVSMLILAFHGTQETATQVTALIMAGAAVVAYIIGEGLADAAHTNDHYEFDYGYDQGWDDAVENSIPDAESVENTPKV